MRMIYVLVLAAACGKTSKPTPEGTGSGTVTTGGDHSGGSGSATGSGSARGVGSAGSADPSDPFERSLVAFTSLRERMCACVDTACTAKVMADFQIFRGETKQLTVGKTPTQAQRDRGVAL